MPGEVGKKTSRHQGKKRDRNHTRKEGKEERFTLGMRFCATQDPCRGKTRVGKKVTKSEERERKGQLPSLNKEDLDESRKEEVQKMLLILQKSCGPVGSAVKGGSWVKKRGGHSVMTERKCEVLALGIGRK